MGEAKPPNVVLIVLDACRADYLSPYNRAVEATPAIRSLSEAGTTFERAVSTAPWTLPSATSILTGKYPHEHGATSRGFELQRGRTITDDLSSAGYRCVHLSPKTWIGDWLPQGRGFDSVEEFTGPRHRYFDGGADVRRLSEGVSRGTEWYTTVMKRALASDAPARSLGNAAAFRFAEATGDAWLDNVRASERAASIAEEYFADLADDDRPFFMYAHLMNPHLPFYLPEDFRTDGIHPPGCDGIEAEREYMESLLDDIWDVRLGNRRLSEEERRFLRTRYRDEIEYADAAIGRILDGLERHGLDDETLVVFTADHGEHLGEAVEGRTLIDHQTSVRLPVLRVPLILRYPGVFDGDERAALVQPNYIAETVRALAGLDYDRSRSLLERDDDHRRTTALAEYAGVVASHPPDGVADDRLSARRKTAITGDWKLDTVDDVRRAARIDWAENAASEVPVDSIPETERTALADALSVADAPSATATRPIPDDVEETLSDLGYL